MNRHLLDPGLVSLFDEGGQLAVVVLDCHIMWRHTPAPPDNNNHKLSTLHFIILF